MGLLSTAKKVATGLLDMDTPSRMARAKEQGFDVDTPMYHGTNVEFDSFDANLGNQRDAGFYGSGNYFSPDKEVAENYAGSLVDDTEIGDVNVVKAMLNYKKPFIWDKENPDALLSLLNDAGVRSPYVDNIANSRDLRAFDKYLKDNGHDAVIVKNRFGDIDEVMVPSSSQIRSPDAAFDPAKASSSNLLASRPEAAIGGLLALSAMGASEDADAGILGKATGLLMDTPSRMARAKEQGYLWANPLEPESIGYSTKVITNGSPEAVKFSKYLSEKGIPHKSHKAKTGSTYITIQGDPYQTMQGNMSLGDLEYRFSDHSKDQYKKMFDNQKVDNYFEADVFPNGHTLEDAIRKVESTGGIRSVDAAFDPAKISSSNLLASNPVATTSSGLLANVTGQPSNLSSYMQGNTDAYLTNAERQYLQNKQAFESNFSDDTGWDRADILPFRVNEQTGEREFATPEMIKGLLSGIYDIGQSKDTKIKDPASLLEFI